MFFKKDNLDACIDLIRKRHRQICRGSLTDDVKPYGFLPGWLGQER